MILLNEKALNIKIDEVIHRKLKTKAAQENTTVKDLILKALELQYGINSDVKEDKK